MNANRIFWGLIFISAGVFWLLGNLGIISGDYWAEVWRLWPLLLVLWGISLLIGKDSRFGAVFSGISVIIIIAAILGFGWLYNNQKILNHNSSTSNISETLEASTKDGQLNLKFGAAKMNIGSGTDKFIEGSAETFSGIEINRSASGATQKVEIDQVGNSPVFWGGKTKNEINLKLNDMIPYALKIDTGASDFDLDFSSVEVSSLVINGGATNGDIRLSNKAKQAGVNISSGASSFAIKIPNGVAIKVENKSGLSNINAKDLSLSKDGDTWKSPDYDSAEKRILITFSAGASSLDIQKY